MTNITIPAVASESAKANDNKASEKAKPSADKRAVVEDEVGKGKSILDCVDFVWNACNRVLLYEPKSRGDFGWRDRGAGHVACVQSPNQPDAWWIVVSNEKNLLESRILPDTIYDKYPGSCLVWSEPDGEKFAICFQENAGRAKIWDKICQIQLEGKRRNSEAERRQTLENNRQLTVELNTLQAKNRETLERNRELEQELSNAQAKIRDLEEKFDQTDSSHVIAAVKKMENSEISRLQTEVVKLSNENEMKIQENSEIRKKLVQLEGKLRNSETQFSNFQKAEMAEELKSWEHFRQLLGGANQLLGVATEYADGIRKRKAKHGLVDPPVRMIEDPEEDEIRTELGSDGTLAKRARIDTQNNLEGAGAKKTANVASGSKAIINS